jgi:chaperonin cofactor prefoldin
MNLENRIEFLEKQKEALQDKLDLMEDDNEKYDEICEEIDALGVRIGFLQDQWEVINLAIENQGRF